MDVKITIWIKGLDQEFVKIIPVYQEKKAEELIDKIVNSYIDDYINVFYKLSNKKNYIIAEIGIYDEGIFKHIEVEIKVNSLVFSLFKKVQALEVVLDSDIQVENEEAKLLLDNALGELMILHNELIDKTYSLMTDYMDKLDIVEYSWKILDSQNLKD